LVSDGEGADLLDGIAEEVDADGVLERRREHVHQAAPDAELPSPFHEVDPDVRRSDQVAGQLFDVVVRAGHDAHREQVGQATDLGLQHRPDRSNHHLRRWEFVVPDHASQHGQASANGVGSGAQPLVRERLPGRVVGDLVLAEE